jgi:hypothetical protein
MLGHTVSVAMDVDILGGIYPSLIYKEDLRPLTQLVLIGLWDAINAYSVQLE